MNGVLYTFHLVQERYDGMERTVVCIYAYTETSRMCRYRDRLFVRSLQIHLNEWFIPVRVRYIRKNENQALSVVAEQEWTERWRSLFTAKSI